MKCSSDIPRITYREFGERLHEATSGRRIPWCGSIELTERCNLNCVHCYISHDANDTEARKQELTGSELEDIFDAIVSEGCLFLLLTGGEPLLRSDFLDLYLLAKRKGLLVTLFTNGTMMTAEVADFLAEFPPRGIEITLYGASEQTYETVTRVRGSYSRCIRGIELLLDRGLPLGLKTMLMTVNKHELRAMKGFAERLGIEFRYDASLNLRIDGAPGPARFRISPEEIVECDQVDERRMVEMRELLEKFSGPRRNPEMLYSCGAGVSGFHIDAYGRLSVCIMSRQPAYELRNGNFQQGWAHAIPTVLDRKRQSETPCQSCHISSLCDQCPGWGQLEWGDAERPVEFSCQTARLRAAALGFEQFGQGASR